MLIRILVLIPFAVILGCAHVELGEIEAYTFGTARVEATDGTKKVTVRGDGTNVFGIVAHIVDAARKFFGGGGDTVIQLPAGTTIIPAPPAMPESPDAPLPVSWTVEV